MGTYGKLRDLYSPFYNSCKIVAPIYPPFIFLWFAHVCTILQSCDETFDDHVTPSLGIPTSVSQVVVMSRAHPMTNKRRWAKRHWDFGCAPWKASDLVFVFVFDVFCLSIHDYCCHWCLSNIRNCRCLPEPFPCNCPNTVPKHLECRVLQNEIKCNKKSRKIVCSLRDSQSHTPNS